MSLKTICLYCGSNAGAHPRYTQVAANFGRLLAEKNIALVYGGGKVGLMGATAEAVIKAGGKVIGIMPEGLAERELALRDVIELHIVKTMHDRKAMMERLSDAFVVLPGGLGTFDEFFEILTWKQLGFHDKPIAILNTERYYDALLQFLHFAAHQGFVKSAALTSLIIERDETQLIETLLAISNKEMR
jgi:uncharacterized protein (TIGR00730 family)